MIFVLLGNEYFSLICLSSLLITFCNSFFDEIIFLKLIINSANFLISISISFIPKAVSFCNLNSNIAFICYPDRV